MSAQTPISAFLALPTELRLQIYEYVLIAPKDGSLRAIQPKLKQRIFDPQLGICCKFGVQAIPRFCTYCKSKRSHYICWDESSQQTGINSILPTENDLIIRIGGQVYPAILQCSKLIHREAVPILYSNTHLIVNFDGTFDGQDTLRALPTFTHPIAHLSLRIRPPHPPNPHARLNMLIAMDILDQTFDGHLPRGLSSVTYQREISYDYGAGLTHTLYCRCLTMNCVGEPPMFRVRSSSSSAAPRVKGDKRMQDTINAYLAVFHKRKVSRAEKMREEEEIMKGELDAAYIATV